MTRRFPTPATFRSLGLATSIASALTLSAMAQSVEIQTGPSTPSTPNDSTLRVVYTPAPGTNPAGARVLFIPTLTVDPSVPAGSQISSGMANTAYFANQIAFAQLIQPALTESELHTILDLYGDIAPLSGPGNDPVFPIDAAVLHSYLTPLLAFPGNLTKLDNVTQPLQADSNGLTWSLTWEPNPSGWTPGTSGPLEWSLAQGTTPTEIDINDLARLLAAQTGMVDQNQAVLRHDPTIEDMVSTHLKKLLTLVIKFVAVVVTSDGNDFRLIPSQPTGLQDLLPIDVGGSGQPAPFETLFPLYRLTATHGEWFYPALETSKLHVEIVPIPGVRLDSVDLGAVFMNHDNSDWRILDARMSLDVSIPVVELDLPPAGWSGNYSVYYDTPTGPVFFDLTSAAPVPHPTIGHYYVIEAN